MTPALQMSEISSHYTPDFKTHGNSAKEHPLSRYKTYFPITHTPPVLQSKTAEEQPKQFNHWNAVAAFQMNQALAGYRHAIEKVTRNNVAAVFASSALTAVYFVRTSVLNFGDLEAAFPLSAAHTSEMAGKMISCIVRTMWGLRGPLEVLMKGWS